MKKDEEDYEEPLCYLCGEPYVPQDGCCCDVGGEPIPEDPSGTGGNYSTGRIPMISAWEEVERNTFKKVRGETRIWYMGTGVTGADHIYYKDPNDNNLSKGFGGGWLDFKLEDGTVDRVQGPWHSNPKALLEETGVDLTSFFLTKVILCLGGIRHEEGNWTCKNVIYKEADFHLGKFERAEDLAQEYANRLGKRVHYLIRGKSGDCSSFHRNPEIANPVLTLTKDKGVDSE